MHNDDAKMSYVHFKVDVAQPYNLKMIGWPTEINFANPSNIGRIDHLRDIRDKIRTGEIRFEALSLDEARALEHEIEVLRTKQDGQRKMRKERKDKGMTHAKRRDEESDRDEESGEDEEEEDQDKSDSEDEDQETTVTTSAIPTVTASAIPTVTTSAIPVAATHVVTDIDAANINAASAAAANPTLCKSTAAVAPLSNVTKTSFTFVNTFPTPDAGAIVTKRKSSTQGGRTAKTKKARVEAGDKLPQKLRKATPKKGQGVAAGAGQSSGASRLGLGCRSDDVTAAAMERFSARQLAAQVPPRT